MSQDVYQAIKDFSSEWGFHTTRSSTRPSAPARSRSPSAGRRAGAARAASASSSRPRGDTTLLVTTAEKEIKARLFKKEFGTKDIRFANRDELMEVTGCDPGSVPPFGHRDPSLPFYVDENILRTEHFMFNPAIPTKSFRIRTGDLLRIYAAIPNPVSTFGEDEEERFVIRKVEKTA